MKKLPIFVVLTSSLLSGCVTGPVVISDAATPDQALVPVTDNRAASQKEARLPSFGEAIYFMGDSEFKPGIPEALSIELSKALEGNKSSASITLEHSEVMNYFGAHDNATKSALLGPLIWSNKFVNSNFVKCSLEGKVGDANFTVAYAEPYKVKSLAYMVVYQGPDAYAAAQTVVTKCIDLAANRIKSLTD